MATESAHKCANERGAADYLGYAPATLRQSRWTGTLAGHPAPQHLKLGRSVRYRIEDLDNWLAQYAQGVKA